MWPWTTYSLSSVVDIVIIIGTVLVIQLIIHTIQQENCNENKYIQKIRDHKKLDIVAHRWRCETMRGLWKIVTVYHSVIILITVQCTFIFDKCTIFVVLWVISRSGLAIYWVKNTHDSMRFCNATTHWKNNYILYDHIRCIFVYLWDLSSWY